MEKPRIRLYGPSLGLAELQADAAPQRRSSIASAAEGAMADFAAALGKVIEVDYLVVNLEDGAPEFFAEPGRPFAVRVLPTECDAVTRTADRFVDPVWNVEILDGRGMVPAATAASGFAWTLARAFEAAPQQAATGTTAGA